MIDLFERSMRVCVECQKEFSLYKYNIRDYVYKVKEGGFTKYMCSYPCYRKYKSKIQAKER